MKIFWIALASMISTAYAQTNTTTLNTSTADPAATSTLEGSVGGKINTQFEEDKNITDAKLRAEAGSRSKYSLRFSLGYYGPTLGNLSAKDQPNPDGTTGTYETALSGSLGFRYRLDPSTSLSMGTGLRGVYPLHGLERVDLNDPYLSYEKTAKLGEVQLRNAVKAGIITVPNYTKIGEYGSLGYDFASVYNIGMSGFAVGMDMSIGYYLYNRAWEPKDRKATQYSVSLYPNVKYNVSDRFNVNTSWTVGYLNLRTYQNRWQLMNRTIKQRAGLGYAFTRDIYVSPYIEFFPNRLSSDATTMNVSTSFSLL